MITLIALGVAAVVIICAADVLAPRVKAAPPLLLVLIGLALSLLPGLGTFQLDPELVLEVILPPLLYAAAVAMPAMSFRREMPSITGLSVVLVVLSSLVLGLLFMWLLPGIGFGWGAALGAILSPTDAVATSIIKGRGVPDRVVTILEGESLLNDATALVILATAIGASSGGFSLGGAVGSFAYSVVVALAIGVLVGFGNFWVRRRITSPTVNTILSFTLPFIASAPAEMLGSSGLVAAVVAGLVIGFRGPRELPPAHRLASGATWASIQMLLEGFVFLSMGLELSAILAELSGESVGIGSGLLLAALALVVILVARGLFLTGQLAYLGARSRHGQDMQPRIDAMRERLEEGRRRTAERLEAIERARQRVGTPDATPEQLKNAYLEELHERAEVGDEQAIERLEAAERAQQQLHAWVETDRDLLAVSLGGRRGRTAGLPPSLTGMSRRARRKARRLAGQRTGGPGVPPGGRRPGRARGRQLGRRAGRRSMSTVLPDAQHLERYSTRLRRASADIGYLARQPLGAREGAVLVWAGMRGAVTVAAAQTLPEDTPHRSLLVFIAFAVATLSLLIQGGTIGMLVRRLFSAEPSAEEQRHENEQRTALFALMDAAAAEAETDLEDGTSEKRRRLLTLGAQRDTLLDARDDGLFDADMLEQALLAVDSEEIALAMQGGPDT